MKNFLFALCALVMAALVARAAGPVLNAVYDCAPSGYNLARTTEGYTLAGAFDAAPRRAYDVAADPVLIDTGNIGRTTLRMTAREAASGPVIADFTVDIPLGTTLPISHLKITVEKDFAEGPSQIDCRQIGGSQ